MIETMVQYSIFLGNKPGLLSQIFATLAAAKVNIVALTMMDVSEHGVLRIVARDAAKAKAALDPLNLQLAPTSVLAVTMPNKPGALADVCEKLSASRVQISYLYSTTGAPGGKAIGIFKVQNPERATKALETKRSQARDMKTKLRNHQRARTAGRR
ncbi:MAG: ACT domain-containing protein [Phycisphaerales bacterium]|nr:ACT domain-containing protein [Phycisphaerales bacterium]